MSEDVTTTAKRMSNRDTFQNSSVGGGKREALGESEKEEEEVGFFSPSREGAHASVFTLFPQFLFPMDTKPQPSLSPCDTEKLKRCLEEHGGDASKCSHLISAFKSSCGKQQQQQQTEEASPWTSNKPTEAVAATTTPTTEK